MARKSRTPLPSAGTPPPELPLAERIHSFVVRHALALTVLLLALGSVRIGLTWTVFHHTSDEPAHIACGLEWLERGTYRFETQHPPLARVVAALGARLDGARLNPMDPPHRDDTMWWHGASVLFGSDSYTRRLASARAGILAFFWLASAAVYLWGALLLGPAGAVLAVFLFSMLPVILAHSGLATTDAALTATMAMAAYALYCLWERPGLRTTSLFGFTLALMLLSKHSGIAYFGLSVIFVLAYWAWRRRGFAGIDLRPRLLWTPAAAALALLLIWAAYRFSFGPSSLVSFPVPFPEWFDGIKAVLEHNRGGHSSYFLGSVSPSGSWLFFPTLFLVKTPVGVLVLFALSAFLVPRARCAAAWLPWEVVAAIFVIAISARINIGLRHILPVFPFVALLAASAALALWERAKTARWAGVMLAGLLVWIAAGSLLAHPDYLADFNLLAGDHPENIAVDSDLDWGQDILRLSERLRELKAPSVAFTAPIYTSFAKLGFPPVTRNDAYQPTPGWNAISLIHLKLYRLGGGERAQKVKLWPEIVPPTEIVGRSIWLYYLPPRLSSPVQQR